MLHSSLPLFWAQNSPGILPAKTLESGSTEVDGKRYHGGERCALYALSK